MRFVQCWSRTLSTQLSGRLHFLLPSPDRLHRIPFHINGLAAHPVERSLPLMWREVYMNLANLHLPKLNYDRLRLPSLMP